MGSIDSEVELQVLQVCLAASPAVSALKSQEIVSPCVCGVA